MKNSPARNPMATTGAEISRSNNGLENRTRDRAGTVWLRGCSLDGRALKGVHDTTARQHLPGRHDKQHDGYDGASNRSIPGAPLEKGFNV